MKLIPNLASIDTKAIQDCGIPGILLMEEAGAHVTDKVVEVLEAQGLDPQGAHVVLVCGPGNNGGDGFVCARRLSRYGVGGVTVLFWGDTDKLSDDAAINFNMLQWTRVSLLSLEDVETIQDLLDAADLIVDAMFGSGLTRDITGEAANLIQSMNEARKKYDIPTVSVDLPSGVDGATGQILGVAAEADHTITFAAGKPGLFLMPGKAYSGEVDVVDIGIPDFLLTEHDSNLRLITPSQTLEWLPTRSLDAHKYSIGHLLTVAGSQYMPGAPALVTEAAMLSGCGMVTLAAPASMIHHAPVMPEVVLQPMIDDGTGYAIEKAVDDLLQIMSQKRLNAICVGPGLGKQPETMAFVAKLLATVKAHFSGTVVVDADALNALAQLEADGQNTVGLDERFIITPHVGEFKRLLPDIEAVETDWVGAITKARKRFGCNVVLKSSNTMIATTRGNVWISPVGNPGMATAGSGDVLTGIIGAMAAQGLEPWVSAVAGVYLHGLSGDLASQRRGMTSLVASDITMTIPDAIVALAKQELLELESDENVE